MTRHNHLRRRARLSQGALVGGMPNIPPIKSNIEFRHRYRFTSTSATPTALTGTSLLGAAGTMCTVANSVVCAVASSVKISNISIWTPPASQGSPATCSVDWIGYQNSPDREVSDTSVSVSTPAKVSTSPPRNSLAAFWQLAGGTALCTLTAPVGSVIDVDLALIFNDDDGAVINQISVTTGTLGASYYLSLDPNGTHRYTPVSLNTTT
jgi:hypothetical protein